MCPNTFVSTAHGFDVEPCSERCRALWHRGNHALLGISTGNSYFTQDRLLALANWAGHHFAEVDLMYVDTHIGSTLMAGGRTATEASRLVKSRLRDVRRKLRRVLERVDHGSSRFRARPLSALQDAPAYRAAREAVDHKLATDPRFASACEDMVRRYLSGKTADGTDSAGRVRAGTDYLLAELPFFVDSPGIFGAESSVCCYHTSTPLVEYLAHPENRTLPPERNQGFLVVKPSVVGALRTAEPEPSATGDAPADVDVPHGR